MEKLQSRRDFLKVVGKLGAGVALAGVALPAMAQSEAPKEEKVPYHWEPTALPCELIKELPAAKEGFRSFEYASDGRAHIKKVTFDVKTEDLTVHNIVFEGGCDGSTHGVAAVAVGQKGEDIVAKIKGLQCDIIKSGSSCPDQLANAVEQALKIITGKSCTYCFFAGKFSRMKCTNA